MFKELFDDRSGLGVVAAGVMPTGEHDYRFRTQIRAERRRVLKEGLELGTEGSFMLGMSKLSTTPKLECQRLELRLNR